MDSASSPVIFSPQSSLPFDRTALLVPDLESSNDWSAATNSPSHATSAMSYYNFSTPAAAKFSSPASSQQMGLPQQTFQYVNFPPGNAAGYNPFDSAALLDMGASITLPTGAAASASANGAGQHHGSSGPITLPAEALSELLYSSKPAGSASQSLMHPQLAHAQQGQFVAYSTDISQVPNTPDQLQLQQQHHHHQYMLGMNMMSMGMQHAAPMAAANNSAAGIASAPAPAHTAALDGASGGLDMNIIAKLTSSGSSQRRKQKQQQQQQQQQEQQQLQDQLLEQEQQLAAGRHDEYMDDGSTSISESETSSEKPRAKRYPVPEELIVRKSSEPEFKSKLKGTRGRRRRSIMSALPPDELQAELDARLNRNRQSARDCRLRKKYYITTLEKQVDDLRRREEEKEAELVTLRDERNRLAEECERLRAHIAGITSNSNTQ